MAVCFSDSKEAENRTDNPATQDTHQELSVAEEGGCLPEGEKGGYSSSKKGQTKSSEEEKKEFEEDTQIEGTQAEPSSPPLPTAKGSYHIDFDNLDEVNPFVTKAAVGNSPVSKTIDKSPNSLKLEDENVDKGETEEKANDIPQSKITDSSPLEVEGQVFKTIIAEQSDDIFSQSFEDIDPFEPKKQLMNSPQPQAQQKADSANGTSTLQESGKLLVSVEKDDIIDPYPFATKTKVMNTPIKDQDVVVSLITQSQEADAQEVEPMEMEEMTEPFVIKSKVVNSPSPTSNEIEEGAMKKEDSSSDKIREMEVSDPLRTVSKVENSPVKEESNEEVNAFATKAKIANSPFKETINFNEEADPFATNAKVPNSPVLNTKENVDPSAVKSKVANSPLPNLKENEDPFATKSKIANSPLPNVKENEDPFATKSKVANSPLPNVKDIEDPFATKSKVANSPLPNVKENEDPFATKSKVANSPLPNVKENEDSFATKSKVANSPSQNKKDTEENPFASKGKVANSPSPEETEDPFAPKTKIAKSPLPNTNAIDDPFATPAKAPDSPVSKGYAADVNPLMKTSLLNSSSTESAVDELDPFATKSMKGEHFKMPAGAAVSCCLLLLDLKEERKEHSWRRMS